MRELSTVHHGGQLFQQYVVDLYIMCDLNRLEYMKSHQNLFYTDLYNDLTDTLIQDDADQAALRQHIILPSSYTDGNRHMQQLFQDFIAIVQHFDKLTLFVTFTANLNWIEIQHELLPDQSVTDCLDLVAHVFQLKKKALLLNLQTIFSRYQDSV